ncbi:AraC family transcriptional regulator [Algibacter mikhailovii]|uniref:AraC family transcriptional regulator n=1 Tax=Algibacter mikhailovii TaxID=425498 RepID=A0A918RAQ6_9FLAO|nr:AraC family transcriptional regulator [Algibacter mikhailovii]GGZ91768.1 AraC family transcriptional regulator [Algibacter mikhailovii]
MNLNKNFETINYSNIGLFDFVRIARAWKLDFIQLRPGTFFTHIAQVVYKDFQLGNVKLNTAVKQEGFSPEGVWTFAFVNEAQIYWRNYKVEPNSIIIYTPGSEINAVSEANFEVVTFSVSEHCLFEIAKSQGEESLVDSLKHIELLVSKNPLLIELKNVILNEINQHLQNPNYINDLAFKESFTKKLLVLLKDSEISSKKVSGIKRLKLLHNAEQYILQKITEPITVSALASYFNVSERTLLYAFKNRFNMGPKSFMLVLKLNHAHQRLHEEDEHRSISSIIKDSGFWHLGRFYKDYKSFFGELPSKTLSKNSH